MNTKPNFKLTEKLCRVLDANLVPFITGAPGIGKSAAIAAVAKEFDLILIDMRLSGFDATDITGIPNFVETDSGIKRCTFTPNSLFPLKEFNDERKLIKKDGTSYNGWLILLDELTSANESVLAACYQLILDRKVGEFSLCDQAYLVAAGNGENDGAIANDIGTALKSRVVTIQASVEYQNWMEWAASSGKIHSKVISYLSWRPSKLHEFNPKVDQLTFPCPRSWEMMSALLFANETLDKANSDLFAGTIGACAAEFEGFLKVYSKLPDLKVILANPANAPLPDDASQQYAMSGIITEQMKEAAVKNNQKEIDDLFIYTERFNKDLQVVIIKNALKGCPAVVSNKSFNKWLLANAKLINGSV